MQSSAQRTKRRFHRSAKILLAILSLPILSFLALRLLPGAETDLQISSIRTAGLPTSLEELNRWYAQIPTSSNAALVIMEAMDEQVEVPGVLDDWALRDLAEVRADLENHLKKNKAALDLLHKAADLPLSRYSLNLTNSSLVLPHLAGVKSLVRLLSFEGAHHAIRGQPDLAFRSAVTGFATARTLRHEPLLISELVRIACLAITLNSVENLLSNHPLSEDQLVCLSQILHDAEVDGPDSSYRALVGERAIILSYFNGPPSELQRVFAQPNGTIAATDKLKASAYRLLAFRDRDRRLFLEVMDSLTKAMTNTYPEALRQADEVDADIDHRLATGFGRFAIVSRSILHAMHRVVEKEAAIMTRLRCARTALAIERYRLAHDGTLPKGMNELIPLYLSELPGDPAEGQPLEFKHLKTGFQISSPAAARRLKNTRTAVFHVLR